MITFKDLLLMPGIQQALDGLGFTTPTEIQRRAIPILIGQERIDLHGQAQTGTGKTLAFGIPLLQKIDSANKQVQGLIVAPTRELALQTTESLRQAARHLPIVIEPIYGGASMEEQVSKLRRGVHIVVGTPGRLNDHLRRKTLVLKNLNVLVLDEADIMLELGFKEEVDEILSYAPKQRQIWLFSATVKPGIDDIMKTHMKQPVTVRVSAPSDTRPQDQFFCVVPQKNRIDALARVIDTVPEFYGFIFCQTKILTSEVAERLVRRGYKANALHGDLSQAQRNRVTKKFRDKEFTILVATDVAARGIDVPDLTHVINYSLPDDSETYVHRIGRTGRAGKLGIAITFVAPSEVRRLKFIERKFKLRIHPMDVPGVEQVAQIRVRAAQEFLNKLSKEINRLRFIELIKPLVDHLSEQERTDIVMAFLHDKFFTLLAKEADIPFKHVDDQSGPDNLTELFVSMGYDDQVANEDITRLLVDSGKLAKADIKRIKMLRNHSFVVVATQQPEELLESLKGASWQSRKVRVSVTGESPNMRERPMRERSYRQQRYR